MKLRLPREGTEGKLDIYQLAHLFEHDLAHCRGYKHKGMCSLNSWKHATPEQYPYLDGMEVGHHVSKAKPKPAAKDLRYQRVLANITRWKTKAKRAENALKKLDRQRRYYENAL